MKKSSTGKVHVFEVTIKISQKAHFCLGEIKLNEEK